jgi:hypothetical protein
MSNGNDVNVYFLNSRESFQFYVTKDKKQLFENFFGSGDYSCDWTFRRYGMSVEDLCEYVFDVTNNPSRQEERESVYGLGRSLSVGDVVTVDGDAYLCDSVGWLKV